MQSGTTDFQMGKRVMQEKSPSELKNKRKTYLDRHALGVLNPNTDVDPDCTNAPNQVAADSNDQKANNLWKNSQHVNYTPRNGRKHAFVVITTANPSHP